VVNALFDPILQYVSRYTATRLVLLMLLHNLTTWQNRKIQNRIFFTQMLYYMLRATELNRVKLYPRPRFLFWRQHIGQPWFSDCVCLFLSRQCRSISVDVCVFTAVMDGMGLDCPVSRRYTDDRWRERVASAFIHGRRCGPEGSWHWPILRDRWRSDPLRPPPVFF